MASLSTDSNEEIVPFDANDLKILEKGTYLKKMRPNRKEFEDRFYCIDSKNSLLLASSRQTKKGKICKSKLTVLICKFSNKLKDHNINK